MTQGVYPGSASRRIIALRPALFVLKGVSRAYKAIRLRDENEVPDLPSTLSSKLTLTLSPEEGEEQEETLLFSESRTRTQQGSNFSSSLLVE